MAGRQFRFNFVVNGQAEISWRGLPGELTDDELVLGEHRLPLGAVADTAARDERLVVALLPDAPLSGPLAEKAGADRVLVLHLFGIKEIELKRAVDRSVSSAAVARHRADLEAAGRLSEFRAFTCPCCAAVVDLTGVPATHHAYCPHCGTVATDEGKLVTDGAVYRLCDECSFFGRVQGYTEFYFYFLLVVYGWRMNRRHLCDSCARSLMLKALGMNLIFVLGVPTALWGLWKSYRGRAPFLADLPDANRLARAGRHAEADVIYRRHTTGAAPHPGVAMNQGLGHLIGKDPSGAVEAFRQSLESCGNYVPTLRLLARLQAASAPSPDPKG